ncbi:MAG: glycosyltransferase family 4 protein [Sulfuricellaceae bacterium]|jgi:UDP-glucose:(heptosyl)LPS alpha-1,3-glucosyltransferase
MKIALVRQRYTPYGGAERFVSRAMQTLKEQGAEITLITRHWESDANLQALTCDPFYLGSLWRDWGFSRCVRNTLARHDFDLVQSHERIPGCDVYRAGDGVHREWLAQRRRVLGPLGRLGLMLNPYHRYTLAAEQRLFSSPRLQTIICNSRMVRDELRYHFGLPEEKLPIIYSGVDTATYHPRLRAIHRQPVREAHRIPAGASLFLFVGSGFERKGVPTLLHAMAQLPDKAHLMVIGKDKRQPQSERLATKLGLASRVHFLGGQKDVRPFYGAADIFVLPTLYDPFPNVALEAMACGLPVVTSNKSGAAELIDQGVEGFVCDALDAAALAAHLTSLLEPNAAASMGQAARTKVEPYTLEKMGEALLELYRSLLSQKKR